MLKKLSVFAVFGSASLLLAEEGAAHAVNFSWASPLSVGLGIALAAAGGALAQGKIAAAFMEGVSRNPGAQKLMFVPLILSLALVETLVLFTFLVVNGLSGKF